MKKSDYRLLLAASITNLPEKNGYSYYIDLKQGAFIYVFPEKHQPPEGWPLVKLDKEAVENMLKEEFE